MRTNSPEGFMGSPTKFTCIGDEAMGAPKAINQLRNAREAHREEPSKTRVSKNIHTTLRLRFDMQFEEMEMSRQRLRPSLIEITGDPCPHCGGTGFMRSTDWTALQVLRAMEETANRERATSVELTVSAEVALYILN